jgi:hypothetical protein
MMSAIILDPDVTDPLPQSVDCASANWLLITAGKRAAPIATVEIIATAKWVNAPQICKSLINTCGKGLLDDRTWTRARLAIHAHILKVSFR